MTSRSARPNRQMVRRGLAACVWLAALGATTTAHGQCLEGHLFASDGAANDFFAYSVAISSDTMIVGAPYDDTPSGTDAGSAYVYVRSGGVWTQQQKLTASDGAAFDLFGFAVAISGDTLVVGAVVDNTPGGTDAGSAYVFVRSGGVWTQQQKLTAADGAAFDEFGYSVAISGETIVVGAWSEDTMGTDAGSAYVFKRNGTIWTQQAQLFASDGAAGDDFFSVAISGDTIVVGADYDDTPAGADAGSAYVFVRNGSVWTEQAHLFASDGATFDYFGVSVSISDDTVVIGASKDDTSGGTDAGSAYVFVRNGTDWAQQDHLVASDGAPDDTFGWCVAIDGDTAVAGAVLDDTPVGIDAGSAYVFVRNAGVWSQHAHLFASDGAADDRFCRSVAMSGDTAVAGTIRDDTPAGTDAGSAYVFALGCTPGDLNCDDAVNFADVDGFALALVDMPAYLAAYPTCDPLRADVNQDGQLNGRDTQAFVAALLAP